MVGIIHWTISKHIKDGSERKVILWVENVVMVCLLGAFVKGEIFEVAGTQQPHLSFGEDILYLFGALVLSLSIYRIFTWGRD